MKMKFEKKQLLTFIEAFLFIIGGILLFLNIMNGKGVWFYIGIALALIAVIIWAYSFIIDQRKKH